MSYLKTILVVFVLMLVAAPFFVSAGDEKPMTCCKLRHTIDIDDKIPNPVAKGTIVGPEAKDKCPEPLKSDPAQFQQASNWAMYCSLDSIMVVADLIKWFGYVATGVVFVVAGALFITAGASPERVGLAKKFFFYGFIGAMVIIFSHLIPSIGRFFIGG